MGEIFESSLEEDVIKMRREKSKTDVDMEIVKWLIWSLGEEVEELRARLKAVEEKVLPLRKTEDAFDFGGN